jgi:hypothetical protein
MSLRPQLQGFDLQKMGSFFGSKDERIITAVEKKLAPLWREEAEEDANEAATTQRAHTEMVRRAVMSGVPFPDLAEESDHHYDVARAFAATRQKPVRTELAEWGARTFPDFMERFGDRLPQDCRELYSFFLDGRPLFGTQVDRRSRPYAFLARAESLRLASGFQEAQRVEPLLQANRYASGFVDVMIKVLRELDGRGLDVCFYIH